MAKHDYSKRTGVEPSRMFTPDGKWIVFRSKMSGALRCMRLKSPRRAERIDHPMKLSPRYLLLGAFAASALTAMAQSVPAPPFRWLPSLRRRRPAPGDADDDVRPEAR